MNNSDNKHTKLTIFGTGLALVGAALFSVSSSLQQVASAQQQISNANANKTCVVGTVGVFQSSYSPECAGLPGSEMNVDTVNYWPLFPAQNRYGQIKEASLVGLGSTPFTNCSSYMPLSIEQVMNGTSNIVMNELSTNLVSAVNAAYGQYNQMMPTMLPTILSTFGYNATDFQSSDFEEIKQDVESFMPMFSQLNSAIQDICENVTAVNTIDDCATALSSQIMIPMNSTSNRTFQSPIGSGAVYANYTDLLNDLVTAMEQFPVEPFNTYVKAFQILQGLTLGCVAANATNAQECSALAVVPINGNQTNYVLTPAVTGQMGSYIDFASFIVSNANELPKDFQPLVPFANYTVQCAQNGITNQQQCFQVTVGFQTAVEVFNMFYPRLQFKGNNSTVFVASVTAQCVAGDKDIALINQSQNLLIATLFFAWFGVIVAIAGLVVKNKRMQLVPGTFFVLSGALALAALMGLYNSPVYQMVGKSCEPNSICYKAGSSISMAVAAIFLEVVAGIVLYISVCACINRKPEAEINKGQVVEEVPENIV